MKLTTIAALVFLSVPPATSGLPSKDAIKTMLQEQTAILRNGGILPRNLKDMINGAPQEDEDRMKLFHEQGLQQYPLNQEITNNEENYISNHAVSCAIQHR